MKLELGKIKIRDVQFGESTRVEQGVLYISSEEVVRLVQIGRAHV